MFNSYAILKKYLFKDDSWKYYKDVICKYKIMRGNVKNISKPVILFSIVVVLSLFVNLVFNMNPILKLIEYFESKKYYWSIPVTFLFLYGLWLFDKMMRDRIIKERIEIFNATMRTVADILQNTSSSMQLIILDMTEEKVAKDIILRVEKNFEELKLLMESLASINPKAIELKKLNKDLSIIKMNS